MSSVNNVLLKNKDIKSGIGKHFFCKGPECKYFRLCRAYGPVAATERCHCSMKAATDGT